MEKTELQIAGICGSLRKKSYNRQLLNTAISLGQQEGINIVPVETGNLSLYNADQISTRGGNLYIFFC